MYMNKNPFEKDKVTVVIRYLWKQLCRRLKSLLIPGYAERKKQAFKEQEEQQ